VKQFYSNLINFCSKKRKLKFISIIYLIYFHRDLKGKIHRKENIDELLIQTWIDRIESNRKKSYKSMQV
jgi:hypothetical protein